MATLYGFLARVLNGAAAVLLFIALVAGLSQNVLADSCSCCCATSDCTSNSCANCIYNSTSGKCKNANGVENGSCASGQNCTDCSCGATATSNCKCK